MAVLLMRLRGPMQSWGTKSKFYDRDTEGFPSKSGVIGLICAALGRDRSDDIADLAELEFGVRVLESGHLKKEYQVAGIDGYMRASGKVETKQAIPYTKHYISDADFLVGFEGQPELLKEIDSALRNPVWAVFLGRKSYVPSLPIFVKDGVKEGNLFDELAKFKDCEYIESSVKNHFRRKKEEPITQMFILDKLTPEHPDTIKQTRIQDQPVSFDTRNFVLRDVDFIQYHYKKSDFPADWFPAEGGEDETV